MLWLNAAALALPVEPVMLSGQDAPGTEPGTTFREANNNRFVLPQTAAINSRGDVVFASLLEGPSVERFVNEVGYWAGGTGRTPMLIARTGDPAPGLPAGFVLIDFDTFAAGLDGPHVSLNDAGQIVFQSASWDNTAPGGPLRRQDLWTGTVDAGLTDRFLSTGEVTPPGPGGGQVVDELLRGNPTRVLSRAEPFPLALNNKGRFIVYAVLDGPDVSATSDGLSVWRGGFDGSLELISGAGNVAPGTDEFVYRGHAERAIVTPLNESGQTVLWSSTTVDQVERPAASTGSEIVNGVWTGTSVSDLQRVFYNDQAPAPGLPGDEQFNSSSGVIDETGRYAFPGVVRNAASELRGVLYLGQVGQTPAPLLEQGQSAPGFGGATVRDFFRPNLRADGGLSVVVTLETPGGENLSTLYVQQPGGDLVPVLQEGQTPFAELPNTFIRSINPPTTNRGGWGVSLVGLETDPNRFDDNFSALIAISPAGEVSLVTYEGDRLEVGPMDLRTVTLISNTTRSNGQDGLPSALNDRNEFVFGAGFADGSNGLFVTTIPEPAAAWLAGLFAVGVRRRHA